MGPCVRGLGRLGHREAQVMVTDLVGLGWVGVGRMGPGCARGKHYAFSKLQLQHEELHFKTIHNLLEVFVENRHSIGIELDQTILRPFCRIPTVIDRVSYRAG